MWTSLILFENGQIDVYLKKSKHSGAYCWGMGKGLPTFVLMNFVNDVRSIRPSL